MISEVEFAFRYTKAKIAAITGSNGKTTTTLLLGHVLKSAGYDVLIAGNVGIGIASSIAERDYDYIVLELSSFQLDGIKKFRSDVAILLNITPDHLDRYDYKLENYAASKFRITENQTVKEIAEAVQLVVGDDVKLITTPTDDNRSYHISSNKIKEELGFEAAHTIRDAAQDLCNAFDRGLLPDSLDNEMYFNINRMKNLRLS